MTAQEQSCSLCKENEVVLHILEGVSGSRIQEPSGPFLVSGGTDV